MKLSTARALAYGATSYSAASMHSIFILYYVQLFLEVFQLKSGWFYFGEMLFMIWNSFNDPWFGYVMDKTPSNSGLSRLPYIKWGGLFWVLSFLFVFIPVFGTESTILTGLHFTLSLCLYDTMLSLVMLAHAALLADMSIDSKERARCNQYSSAGGLIGSSAVLLGHFFWSQSDIRSFQLFCVGVGVLALMCFRYSSLKLGALLRQSVAKRTRKASTPIEDEAESHDVLTHRPPLKRFVHQLLKHRNFWLFVAINFIQVLNCHFNSNFMSLYLEQFIGHKDSPLSNYPSVQAFSMFFGATVPHFLVICLTPYVLSKGVYFVVKVLFFVKLFLGLLLFVLGSESSPVFVLSFILLNKVFSEAICREGNIVVADLVDEDQVLHQRENPISSMIFGANALLTKPGQSIAPIIGWSVLHLFEFREVMEKEDVEIGTNQLRQAMFSMLCLVPIVCSVLQIWLWSFFTLRGEALSKVKARLKALSSNTLRGIV